MRIVGGSLRGRKLKAPKDDRVRPTTDRVREAIFNILAHHTPPLPDGGTVLDLFAGTGAFGLEAVSRGATHATFVDLSAVSLKLARDNARDLAVLDRCTFIKADATKPGTAPSPASLIFADPPYDKGLVGPALVAAHRAGWVDPGTCILVETPTKEVVELPDDFILEKEWRYGQTKITRISLAP